MTAYSRGMSLGLWGCRVCGQIMDRDLSKRGQRWCTRCKSVVTERLQLSSERTLAWLITGVILYFPANMLPVMHTHSFKGDADSTILGGIIEFWQAGSWDIALLIFIASVAVPVTKFFALSLLLWSIRWRSTWARHERTKLYRFVEFIGYWSMLDVAVVAITCSILQFRGLASAEPRLGILFFCGVVVTTMMAALSFDPRLIWDTSAAHP